MVVTFPCVRVRALPLQRLQAGPAQHNKLLVLRMSLCGWFGGEGIERTRMRCRARRSVAGACAYSATGTGKAVRADETVDYDGLAAATLDTPSWV